MGEAISRGDNAAKNDDISASAGWVTTQQAARSLGISARTVRWHIEKGNLEALLEGEGVRRTWLVSIDSLHAFRNTRQHTGDYPQDSRSTAEAPDIAAADIGNPIRELADRLAEEAARAAEYRVRLEITEQAESTIRAYLEDERRRREQAEHERDELAARLKAIGDEREAPTEESTEAPSGGAVRGAREEAATQESPQEEKRRSWWRRFFGFE